jgi:hypothetical protein
MPSTPLPPKVKFAAGLLVTVGTVAFLFAVADALLDTPTGPKREFVTERGYDEGNGTGGYRFVYYLKGTGPGAERVLKRCVGAIAGVGFLAFGVRLFLGTAVTLLPAAFLAVLVGLGLAYESVLLARSGRAVVGLPGLGLAFVLVIGAGLLVAGRNEYVAWRRANAPPPRRVGSGAKVAGALLLVYGLAAVGSSVYRVVSWLVPVRGQPGALALRADVTAGTTLEYLGIVMRPAAEKSSTFTPGPGYFVHPRAVAVVWGGLWAVAGLSLLLGRGLSPRVVGLAAILAGVVVTAFAGLALVAALPWYAALPDVLFPGCLTVVVAGVLALIAPDASSKRR